MASKSSYFERSGEHTFTPTVHAGGAWSPDEQHFSPLGGLIVHEIERARERPDLRLGRISYDILGRISFEEFEIHVETSRAGRTIELVEATVMIAGRAVVTARAWFSTAQDTRAVAGGEAGALPRPEGLPVWPMTHMWTGGYVNSIDVQPVTTPTPGRVTAWISTPCALVAGETGSPLASFLAQVDVANGIAARQDPRVWMFPNLDLTVHLHRQPVGTWTGLDASVTFGSTGQGVTSTVLHDVNGPVGHALQTLTVRRLS